MKRKSYYEVMQIIMAILAVSSAGACVVFIIAAFSYYVYIVGAIFSALLIPVFIELAISYGNKKNDSSEENKSIDDTDYGLATPFSPSIELREYISIDEDRRLFYLWQVMKLYKFEQLVSFQTDDLEDYKTIDITISDGQRIKMSFANNFECLSEYVTYDSVVNALRLINNSNQNDYLRSSTDQVIELKKLFDMGAITQDEFDRKKKQLLDL